MPEPRSSAQPANRWRGPAELRGRPFSGAMSRPARLGCLPGVPLSVIPAGIAHPRVCHSSRHLQCMLASGEGAHGLDRSRLAKYCQRRTNPRWRQTHRDGACPRWALGASTCGQRRPGCPVRPGAVARPGDRTAAALICSTRSSDPYERSKPTEFYVLGHYRRPALPKLTHAYCLGSSTGCLDRRAVGGSGVLSVREPARSPPAVLLSLGRFEFDLPVLLP